MELVMILFFCCACAVLAVTVENVPRPASARQTPATTMNRPIRTRRLKKADSAVGFFFIDNNYPRVSANQHLLLEARQRCRDFSFLMLARQSRAVRGKLARCCRSRF